jgi:hypothetical protein
VYGESIDGDYSVSGLATSARLQARVEETPSAFPLRREATHEVGDVNSVERAKEEGQWCGFTFSG